MVLLIDVTGSGGRFNENGYGGAGGIIFIYFCSSTLPAVNELNIFLN